MNNYFIEITKCVYYNTLFSILALMLIEHFFLIL